ncbi:MAG TPA: SDR family oxidoreductase [Candidatus Binatia bacterium]|jgi:pteridine reductase
MELSGRSALVTGAAQRVGRRIATRLAERGARVAVHYGRSAGAASALVAELRARGREAEAFAADLGDPAAVVALAERVTATLGAVDVLVNNASVYERSELATLGADAWQRHLAVNLTAPYLLALHLGRAMAARGAGKIVNIGDAGADPPYRGYLPYAVSKAGLGALTRGLAMELAPAVQVNCVAPGPILPPAGATAEQEARILARTPLGRFGGPDAVASAVLYLVEADFVTGTTLVVDGGRSLD